MQAAQLQREVEGLTAERIKQQAILVDLQNNLVRQERGESRKGGGLSEGKHEYEVEGESEEEGDGAKEREGERARERDEEEDVSLG